MTKRWKWITGESPRRAALHRAGIALTPTLQVPDLAAFPGPRDKARALLESAAEVEHMLLVQYLYAAFALKTGPAFMALSAPQQAAVRSWRTALVDIAVEEMGHLMSVQNLLLLLREDPTFEREQLPAKADIYPFNLHLEPLTQRSLAKYVLAEAPFSQEPNLARFRAKVGVTEEIHHVGVIYGLLGVLFSSRATMPPADTQDEWEKFILVVAEAARTESEPEHWHLPDGSFDAASKLRQAVVTDFDGSHPGFFFDAVASAEEARALIKRIGVQGEAPAEGSHLSHFRRFFEMYDGKPGTLPFPEDDNPAWEPSFKVDKDPRLESYESPAREKAVEFDAAYAAMLASLAAYMDATDAGQRSQRASDAIDQMRDVKRLAQQLVQMPQKPGAVQFASPLFTMPR